MTATRTPEIGQLKKDADVQHLQVQIRLGELLLECIETNKQQRSQGWVESVMVLTNCYAGVRATP